MNRKHLLVCVAMVCFAWVGLGAELPRAVPKMSGAEIPAPPRQKEGWDVPKSTLPAALVSASTILFDQGLADPRGCDYRDVEIGVGSVWGRESVVKTRAWLLPAPVDAKRRFGVAWNGLVYPLVSVGERASVQEDILAILDADEEMLAKSRTRDAKFPYSRGTNRAIPEADGVSYTNMMPLKVCLLLRVGEVELAEKYWSAFTAAMPLNANNNKKNIEDPYLMLAWDWAWGLFDRAVCAHMRGDDGLALASCRALEPLQKTIDAEAAKRQFSQHVDGSIKNGGSFVGFLEPVTKLLEDQERRAKEGAAPAAGKADGAGRIKALIHDLQDVSVTQWGQPGGISLTRSSIVEALVHEGEPAVGPLLECMESDKRLTRSVSFGRDVFPMRTIHGVGDAAFAAVSQILEFQSFGGGNRPTVAAIRALWVKNKGKPASARWLAVLANDAASPREWMEAAGRIVQPVDVEVRGGWVSMPRRKPGEMPAMRGEALRELKGPSVAELMARRAEAFLHQGRPGSEQAFSLQKAADMALCLGKWDPKAAIPVLRQQFSNCTNYTAIHHPTTGAALTRHIVKLALAGKRAGDDGMLAEYGKWIAGQQPGGFEDDLSLDLEPLWRYPSDPAMIQAANTIFGEAGSWRVIASRGFNHSGGHSPLSTPLIALAPLRALIVETLKDQTEVGKAKVHDAQLTIDFEGGGQMGMGIHNPADPLAPPAAASISIRSCDMLAAQLSSADGAPIFESYWPVAQRDAAIARLGAFLTHYGERYQYSDEQAQLWQWPDEAAPIMTFPALDHPATAEEARDGKAIFSLAGEKGEVRTYKMGQRPLKARWITLKDFPTQSQAFDPRTRRQFYTWSYQQDGRVWQAEEIQTDKGWRRYYGFVGQFIVTRVPAEEMDFPADWYYWGALTGRFDLQVEPPGISYAREQMTSSPVGLKDPLKVTVRIRNRNGMEQSAPTELYHGGVMPALNSGLRVELSYAPPQLGDWREQAIDWQSVAGRRTEAFKGGAGRRVLGPAEAFDAFSFGLRDLFEIDRPGRYRLVIRADKESGLGEGKSNEAVFSVLGE